MEARRYTEGHGQDLVVGDGEGVKRGKGVSKVNQQLWTLLVQGEPENLKPAFPDGCSLRSSLISSNRKSRNLSSYFSPDPGEGRYKWICSHDPGCFFLN